MSEAEALNKIKEGSGRMPSFAGILKGHEVGIIDYLFEKTDERSLQKEADLSEIRNNRLSNIEVKGGNRNIGYSHHISEYNGLCPVKGS